MRSKQTPFGVLSGSTESAGECDGAQVLDDSGRRSDWSVAAVRARGAHSLRRICPEVLIWTRVHARKLAPSHEEADRAVVGRVALLELVSPVLSRALEPFPKPARAGTRCWRGAGRSNTTRDLRQSTAGWYTFSRTRCLVGTGAPPSMRGARYHRRLPFIGRRRSTSSGTSSPKAEDTAAVPHTGTPMR